MSMSASSDRRRLPLRTADVLVIVAFVAIGMTFVWPSIERGLTSRIKAQVLIRVDSPFAPGQGMEDSVLTGSDYLRSSQALEDVRDDPNVSSLSPPPTVGALASCLRERIKLSIIPGTILVSCSLEVD